MPLNLDESVGAPHLGEALTSYCFGTLSEREQEAVEQHLMGCDVCWVQFQRLDAAVRTLRFDATVAAPLPAAEVMSVLGLAGRLDRSFAGHAAFAWTMAILFGCVWTIGL